MKKFDPVSVIGVAVCVLLMVLGGYYTSRQARIAAASQARQAKNAAAQSPSSPQHSAVVVSNESAGSAAALPEQLKPVVPGEPVPMGVEGLFEAEVDSNGSGVERVVMQRYAVQTREKDRKQQRQVLDTAKAPFLGLQVASTPLYQSAPSVVSGGVVTSHRMDGKAMIAFDETWQVGGIAREAEGNYLISYSLTVTNRTGEFVSVPQMSLSCGRLAGFLGEGRNSSFTKYAAGSVAYSPLDDDGGELLRTGDLKEKKLSKKRDIYRRTPVKWVGVNSKYFLFALMDLEMDGDRTGFAGFVPKGSPDNDNEFFSAEALLPKVKLSPGQSITFKVTGYAGPKEFSRLTGMGQGLASVVGMDYFWFWHFDWMAKLCHVMLKAMNFFAGWFPAGIAYGMGIILVTALVKLILMPVMRKSMSGMKKMSEMKPQLDEIRAKYKNDPQRMMYEQQKVYREHGVSMAGMGGCLPMLLQLPIFFAMYSTFNAAIEIRNAPFLWVADLSMPDAVFGLPIHPLALLTGATMYMQQKLMPSPDPNQARMMNIMSLVFIVFFYNMPAGLTLYMTVNQLASIAQMLIFRHWDNKAKALAAKAQG